MEQRRKRRHSPFFMPAVFLLGTAVLVFAISVFFRVYQISVTGNSRYTAEEIVAAMRPPAAEAGEKELDRSGISD